MKKIILLYLAIVYLFCLLLSIIAFISLDLNYKTVFVFVLSLISVFFIICLYLNKKIKLSLLYLTLLNLFQSFSFLILGFVFKFSLGPNLFLYHYEKDGDKFFKFSFHLLETILHVNITNEMNDFLIGINLIHFTLFIFFNIWLYEYRKQEK
jgi:hypothetical protein